EGQGNRPFLAGKSVEVEVIQTLIVCEKPDAAARVARALDEDGDPRRLDTQGVPYYEARRTQETIIVCSALGHLYSIDSKAALPIATILSGTIDGSQNISSTRNRPGSIDGSRPSVLWLETQTGSSTAATMTSKDR